MLKLLIIFLTLFTSNAFAEDFYWTGSSQGGSFKSAQLACQNEIEKSPPYILTSIEYQTDARYNCIAYHRDYGSPPGTSYRTVYRNGTQCPSGTLFNATTGGCESPPKLCEKGVQKWYDTGTSSNLTSVCSSSCTAVATGMQITIDGLSSGQFTTNGESCTGPDTGTPDPGTCPAGTTNIASSGPVNCTADKPPAPKCWAGSTNVSTDPLIAFCVADGGPPKTGPDDPNSHVPDPNKTPTTKTTTVTEPTSDGSVKSTTTTITSTSNTDGSTSESSKTTTTITSPSGESKTTVDGNKTEDPTKDFCKQNPTLTICKNSLVSGDCDTLSIDGDAIQGAILRQQKKEYCENNAASAIKDLGLALLANNDPMKSQFPSIDNASVVDLSNIGNLDSSGFLGGGSCFRDRSFRVSGVTVNIPFSLVCDYLLPFRLAIMLLALMASYKMIAGTILRDL